LETILAEVEFRLKKTLKVELKRNCGLIWTEISPLRVFALTGSSFVEGHELR